VAGLFFAKCAETKKEMTTLFTRLKSTYKNRQQTGGGYALGKNPTADWLLVIGTFLLLTVLFVFITFSHYMAFRELAKGEETNVSKDATLILPDGIFKRVLEYYEGRRSALRDALERPVTVVDPSL